LFGVLLMPLEDFEAGLQQALEFRIAGGRNERSRKRAVDGLVISDLISSAKARTSLFVDFDMACLAASISSCPAV
jgi:hypothetical protein